MDDLLSEFLTESNESLATLDIELVKLEQNPNDPGLLGNIFRLMHTIKGTCGFLGLPRLESVAHAGENVLGKVRDGDLEVSPEIVSIILECLDQIRSIMSTLERTESEPEGDDSDLIRRLNAFADGTDQTTAVPAAGPVLAGRGKAEPAAAEAPAAGEPASADAPPIDEPVAATSAPEPEPVAAKKPKAATKAKSVDKAVPEEKAAEGSTDSGVAGQSIRVNVDLLENLMTMVSELVLTRNQLLQILRAQKESDFTAPLQRLNHVVSELQEGVMKTRMQPIGNAWAKLPRIVRDLAHELGKKIELVMKGADTELDRQVLELIKDPLTHMVRNSADHGLETTAERIAAGKPETGTILLNAYHEGGHIIIEITDDGKGLNIARIRQKAVANGMASEAELDALTEQQVMQFIFKPGFSTAAAVTAVSGRGVGMDVVRTNIEKIGGTIELTSAEGKGTRFVIKIPLTLAIVSALIVECGGERFAIPQLSVIELVRTSSNTEHRIEEISETPVLRLRNRLLPLVNLRNLLRLQANSGPETTGQIRQDHFIVVAQVGTYTFGIIVDRVFDTEEIVVKPVARILRDIQLFSGNTILGDGSVVMILDPNGIAASTGEISVTEGGMDRGADRNAARNDNRTAMLVFRSGDSAPKAVPLALVARLEEIELAKVESSNGIPVVQYRGRLMPLITMDGASLAQSDGKVPVLVFQDHNRSMGLVVDDIVDIVEDRMDIELGSERPGFVGTAIIGGRATDVIDATHYLMQAFNDWFHADSSLDQEGTRSRILVVDDSPFFRNLLSPLLSVAGYEVTSVDSAAAALQLCESGEEFDLIVSDIEMPGMNGFEFAEAVRKGSRWAQTPMVALSSFASPKDLARGRAAGFSDYVAKSDRDALLTTLHDTLAELRGAA